MWLLVVAWVQILPPIEFRWYDNEADCVTAEQYHREHIGMGFALCIGPDHATTLDYQWEKLVSHDTREKH